MSTNGNKDLAHRFNEEVWNQGNVDVLDELCTPDVVVHGAPPDMPPGREGMKALITMYRSAFPDLRVTDHVVIAEGDKVASYWTTKGTHRGELMGIPATGKQVETEGISLSRIEGGKVAEVWSGSDQLSLMQQLGVVPTPGKG